MINTTPKLQIKWHQVKTQASKRHDAYSQQKYISTEARAQMGADYNTEQVL